MFMPTAVSAPEEVLRIRSENADLHAVLHHARGVARGSVLICTPDGEERAWTHRTLVQFARLLAESGLNVMRFDYQGQGESSGVYEGTSVVDRVRDIRAAARLLREHIDSTPIAAVGVRLGAALALEAWASDPGIKCLALWEPTFDVDAYLRNLFRVNATTQMVIYKKVIRTSEELMADVAAGGFVSAGGYKLSQAFVGELSRLAPVERLKEFSGEVLVVALPATRIPECQADIRRRTFLPFWKEPKADMTTPRHLLVEMADWMASAISKGER
jgi:alpha/beta superfamily hydrolase